MSIQQYKRVRVMKNTVNIMVSHNKYRIYEGAGDALYFFVLDKKGKAIYGIGEDTFRNNNFKKLIIKFELAAYGRDYGDSVIMKRYVSVSDPDSLYQKISSSKKYTLICDEKGRYEDKMGEFAKKCYAPEAFYFYFEPEESAKMPAPLYGEYIKVIASDIETAIFWMELCYPSMLKKVTSYNQGYYEHEWKEANLPVAEKEPYEIITKESIEREFGNSNIYRFNDPKEKVRFGCRKAKPRKIKPYMSKEEVEMYERLSTIVL